LSENHSELLKRPSIRIVEKDDDDEDYHCGGFNGDIDSLVKLSSDTVVDIVGETSNKKDDTKEIKPEHNKHSNKNNIIISTATTSKKLPEIKSRLIEDIPEETEPTSEDTTTTPSKDEKGLPAWRLSRRKSLVEIINLLQATAAAAPKLSNIRLPAIPSTKPPLRSRGSVASLASSMSSTTVTEEAPPKTKKERRMGAVVFPGVRFGTRKWGAEESATAATVATGKEKPLFC
jgi:hypothetical protein